jgi:putative NIF3 family GTP cyclohydrolase 1 type 2
MDSELTGRTAELIINAALGNPIDTAMWEGLCAGNSQSVVHGVAVCYAPTLDVLRRAAAERRTLIASREHPFYLHGGFNYGYGTGGLEAALKDDPVMQAKRELIQSSGLMVYRFGAAWDQFRSKAQSRALAESFGLTPLPTDPADRARGIVCTLPRTSLAKLAQTAAGKLKTRHPRVVGDPELVVNRVAVLAGETDPTPGLAGLIADPRIDGVIAGAGGVVDEVDGAIAYFRDVIASGRKIAMLAVGYGPSQEPGVAEMARWLKGVLPTQSVECWPISDPAWIPQPLA